MRISDWSSDVCSSDLNLLGADQVDARQGAVENFHVLELKHRLVVELVIFLPAKRSHFDDLGLEMDRLVAVDLLEGVTHGMAREDRGDLVLVLPLGDAIEGVEGQRTLFEQDLPRPVVSRLYCVYGWTPTIHRQEKCSVRNRGVRTV